MKLFHVCCSWLLGFNMPIAKGWVYRVHELEQVLGQSQLFSVGWLFT